jgi:hypothetical protein
MNAQPRYIQICGTLFLRLISSCFAILLWFELKNWSRLSRRKISPTQVFRRCSTIGILIMNIISSYCLCGLTQYCSFIISFIIRTFRLCILVCCVYVIPISVHR